MKNTSMPEYFSFTELIANNKLTKENMHEAIEVVAGKYMGFISSAYSHEVGRGYESITVYAHYHGSKCYCGIGHISEGTPAIEAISTALTKLNENILNGFEAMPQPEADTAQSSLECLDVYGADNGQVITDAFLSETGQTDLRTEYAA